jgi:hypothetical protein
MLYEANLNALRHFETLLKVFSLVLSKIERTAYAHTINPFMEDLSEPDIIA